MTDSTLSEKRRRAGRRGAAARWGKDDDTSNPHLRTARPVAKLRQGRDDWYRIENRASAKAEVFIYDEIGYFGVTAQDFVDDLRAITANQITLHINSPGGDVFDALVVYNAIRDHAADVEVIVDGIAASSASWIAQAGDRVVMNRGSQLMIHDAWSLAVGNSETMRQAADFLEKQSTNIAGIYAERAGGTVDDWRAAMSAETWYTADEAVEAGLADEVRGRDASNKNSFDLSVFTYAGREKAPDPVIPETAPASPAATNEAELDFDAFAESLKGALT